MKTKAKVMEECVDLHIHSRYSDGLHPPGELVRMAADRGLRAVALADHDTVDGIDEALAAGEQFGVEVIPAVELSVAYRNYHDIHILGYFIDHHDRLFNEKLAEFRGIRTDRGRTIIDRINARLLWEKKEMISFEEVLAMAGGTVGRPHIARILISRGYVHDVQEAFDRYLEPCYVPKYQVPVAEALAEVRRIKGVAVLAHPPSITGDRAALRNLIGELVEMGLEGLEVFANMCYKDDIIFFNNIAMRMGLAVTGGSDYHGFEDNIAIGRGRGGEMVPYAAVEALRGVLMKRGEFEPRRGLYNG